MMVWHQLAELIDLLLSYAYVGAFFVALLGSLIPFLPLPYLIPIVLLADRFDPLLLGTLAGVGGAVGKITSYSIGRLGRRIFKAANRKLEFMSRMIDRYGVLAVFLFALTPLPDDVIYIPVGYAKLNFLKFMLANSAGKIVLAVFVAYLGRTYFDLARLLVGGEAEIYTVVASVFAMIVISIVLFRVDWEEVISAYRSRGIGAAMKILIMPQKKNQQGRTEER